MTLKVALLIAILASSHCAQAQAQAPTQMQTGVGTATPPAGTATMSPSPTTPAMSPSPSLGRPGASMTPAPGTAPKTTICPPMNSASTQQKNLAQATGGDPTHGTDCPTDGAIQKTPTTPGPL